MSYARFSYADVYIYMDVGGHLSCCGCWLGDEWEFHSTSAMIEHIQEHRKAGHDVPDGLEDALRRDDQENFPPQCAGGHDWGEPFHPYPDNEFASVIIRRKCNRCDWTR